MLRVKEYSGAFAFAWERPEKSICLSAQLSVFDINYFVFGELGAQKDQPRENGKSQNPGLLQSTLENTGGMILWPGVSKTPQSCPGYV